MASAPAPACTTSSTSTTATVEGRHRFHIVGYGANKGAGPGHYVTSGTFAVGGFDWSVVFYPEGVTYEDVDYVSLFLRLESTAGVTARAYYDLRILHPATGEPHPHPSWHCHTIDTAGGGRLKYMKWGELEELGYVRNDRLTIECIVNVVQEPVITAAAAFTDAVEVPPSNILSQLGELLDDADGTADVIFTVQGEDFAAHRAVLAMRSPVFKAELYGPMKEKGEARIAVDGIHPVAFKAMLRFIYTDAVPTVNGDFNEDEKLQMIQHLFEAADRYGVERLKLICEKLLCQSIDVDTVASTLALADQHQCCKLREACIEFMATSKKMDDILESQGYMHIRRFSPSFLLDLWETIGRKISHYSHNLCKKK
ncbi:unnamed protein product [Alopecurus aequalis]